jgi:hypothetical protein
MAKSLQQTVEELSDDITNQILDLSDLLLDEIIHTFMYANTAKTYSIIYQLSEENLKEALQRRYNDNSDLLELDLSYYPLIITRLEKFSNEAQEDSIMKKFAKDHLPYAKEFYKMISKYSKSKKEQTQPA